MSVSEYGKRLLAGIEANKLTIDEIEAVVDVLERMGEPGPSARVALEKMHWHIAASRNELTDDYLLAEPKEKKP